MNNRRTPVSIGGKKSDPPLTRSPRSPEDYRFLENGSFVLLSMPQMKDKRVRLFEVVSGRRFTTYTKHTEQSSEKGHVTPADRYEMVIREKPQPGTKWNLRKLDVGTPVFWGRVEMEIISRTGHKLRLRVVRIHEKDNDA